MNKNDNQNLFDNLVASSGGKINRQTISKAAKNGDTSELVNSLSLEDKQKLNNILSDKQALSELLKSPQSQALLKILKKGNNNG